MSVIGSCDCGVVTYSIEDGPLHVYACHCLNCQTRSGSAFAEHVMVQTGAFSCEGTTEEIERSAEGIQFTEVFCHSCHTRLFNRNSMLPTMIFLRAGTLKNSQNLEPMAHIWTSRKQSWVNLAGDVLTFEKSPSPEEFGAAIQAVEQRDKR